MNVNIRLLKRTGSYKLFSLVAILTSLWLVSCDDDSESSDLRSVHQENLRFVDLEGDRIAYLDYGPAEGPVLILLHGIPTSSLLYRNVAPPIARQSGFRVIVPDLLGFGASDKPPRQGAYTLAAHARRTFALADALGIDDFVLGLHDIGGFVGWTMLTQNPDRLSGLVIGNTTAYFEGVTPAPLSVPIVTGEKTPEEVWRPLDDPAFARRATRQFLEQGFADDERITDELVDAYAAPLSEGSSEAFVQFFGDLGVIFGDEAGLRRRFEMFDKPTALVFGAEDGFFDVNVVPDRFTEDFAIPAERVTIVPGAGHYLQEENPAAFVAAVVDFLDEAF